MPLLKTISQLPTGCSSTGTCLTQLLLLPSRPGTLGPLPTSASAPAWQAHGFFLCYAKSSIPLVCLHLFSTHSPLSVSVCPLLQYPLLKEALPS